MVVPRSRVRLVRVMRVLCWMGASVLHVFACVLHVFYARHVVLHVFCECFVIASESERVRVSQSESE